MQGLADGYFVIPYTLGGFIAGNEHKEISSDHPACKAALDENLNNLNSITSRNGTRTVDSIHRELGLEMLDKCGMSRSKEGLAATREKIKSLRDAFDNDLRVPGSHHEVNTELEKALRLDDFLDLADLMCLDASTREESCGGHFREEYQTEEGEAKRNDEDFTHASAWEYSASGESIEHKEKLDFEFVTPSQRSYK